MNWKELGIEIEEPRAILSGPALKRLQKEFQSFLSEPPPGLRLSNDTANSDNLSVWTVLMEGPPNSLYQSESFQLQFKFGANYPFDSPQVQFVGERIPEHSHVYSNGHICLSTLTDDWRPSLTVETVCLSVMSMLASATAKSRPANDFSYVRRCPTNPKNSRWLFHDDNC